MPAELTEPERTSLDENPHGRLRVVGPLPNGGATAGRLIRGPLPNLPLRRPKPEP